MPSKKILQMKSLTIILIAILAITSLIPLKIGILCLYDQATAVEFFALESLTNDLKKLLFVLGGFILASIAMPILSIIFLIKRRAGGIILAYVVGFVAFIRGILTFFNFNSHQIEGTRLTATPIVIGIIILMLTFMTSKQQADFTGKEGIKS